MEEMLGLPIPKQLPKLGEFYKTVQQNFYLSTDSQMPVGPLF